jgi:hypothetical protein
VAVVLVGARPVASRCVTAQRAAAPVEHPGDLKGLFTADRSVSDEVGVHSNCMSCHRAAVYTATKQIDYVSSGYLGKDNAAFFGSGVITGFLWSMPFRAHDGPFVSLNPSTPTTRPTATTQP